MQSNLLPRLLGVIGVHSVAGLLLWLFVRFVIAKQDNLAPALLDRLDGDPARIQTYVDDVSGKLLISGLSALAVTALLACIWLILVHTNPPYGDASARGKRGSWAALMILAVIFTGAVFWQFVISASIGQFIAANIAVNCILVTLSLVVIGYWAATAVFVAASTKVAVPLGNALFGGR
jgi:hypothetical protein